jgi:hypothetical protein
MQLWFGVKKDLKHLEKNEDIFCYILVTADLYRDPVETASSLKHGHFQRDMERKHHFSDVMFVHGPF